MNENVIKILPQLCLENPMTLSPEEKKLKVEKIKNLLNQRKLLDTQATRTTNKLMQKLSINDTKTNDIVQTEIVSQNEIFKKKLEQKRALSNPHKKINNKIKDTKSIATILNTQNNQTVNITTIESKNSQQQQQPFEDNKCNTFLLSKTRQMPKFVRRRQASVIYENKYEGKLEELLIGLWSTCSNITKEATIEKIESIYAEMSERFVSELMSIIMKYNSELKDIDEGDLNDSNNVNAIIYKQLVNDRDNELNELKERMKKEKKEKIEEIRVEQFGIYDKMREISKVKIDVLHELIKNKVPEVQKGTNSIMKDEEEEDNEDQDNSKVIGNNSDDNDTIKNERISRVSINEVKNTDNSDIRVSVLWNN